MTPNQALKQRLADYENHAKTVNNGAHTRVIGPIHAAPISWKKARAEWPCNDNKNKPVALKKSDITRTLTDNKSKLFIDSFEKMPGYVDFDDAHNIANRLPLGWYCDTFQDQTIKAAVISIRHPQKLNPDNDSHVFYLAGTYSDSYDGATVYTGKLFEDQHNAAHYADSMAEKEAESMREYDEKFQAEQRIEELKADYHSLNVEGLALIKEIKQAAGNFTPHICTTLKNEIMATVREKRQLRKAIKKLIEQPGTISESY
jgi:hypothetical protein